MTAGAERLELAYRQIGDRLWRALLGYTGDREIASDALAEAFAQALSREDKLRSPADWVWAAAFRIAGGMLKNRLNTGHVSREAHYDLPDPVEDLVRALARISAHQRLAIVMHDYADRPTSEIATVMGVTTATVHVHLSQGRRRLRKLLEDGDA